MSGYPFHHLVVAWDASPDAAAALDLAIRIAAVSQGMIDAVSVVDPADSVETIEARQRAVEANRSSLEDDLEPFSRRAAAEHVRLRLVFAQEVDPAHALLEHAARHGSDLILIGRRGSTGHLHPGLGPVAKHLVAEGATPVLVTGAG
jgi:nucleotide-binding universal stress UspA family protein